MWTISFIKQGLMKTEYLQHREIMVKYNAREDVIQRHMMRKKCLERWMKQSYRKVSESAQSVSAVIWQRQLQI